MEIHKNDLKSQKRLSEKWLDTLFMILYEDFKFYASIFGHHSTKKKSIKFDEFNRKELMFIGDLAFRLLQIVIFFFFFLILNLTRESYLQI